MFYKIIKMMILTIGLAAELSGNLNATQIFVYHKYIPDNQLLMPAHQQSFETQSLQLNFDKPLKKITVGDVINKLAKKTKYPTDQIRLCIFNLQNNRSSDFTLQHDEVLFINNLFDIARQETSDCFDCFTFWCSKTQIEPIIHMEIIDKAISLTISQNLSLGGDIPSSARSSQETESSQEKKNNESTSSLGSRISGMSNIMEEFSLAEKRQNQS